MKKIMFLTIVILAAIVSSCAIKINDLPQDRNNRTDKTSVAKLEPQKEDYYANVFQIVTYDIDDEPIACGTGFVVSQTGQFITNSHVMDGAYSAKGIFESGSGNSQAYIYVDISGVLYNNENEDLFIGCMADYSRSVSGYRDLKYADSVTKGETTYSIGYPNAVTQMEIHKGKITDDMTTIADKLAHGSSYIGSTSYIAPGSSGGLLVNENGEILGITSRGRTTDYGEFVIGASIETRSFKKVATNAQNGMYISKGIVDTFHQGRDPFIRAFMRVKNDNNSKMSEYGGGYTLSFTNSYEKSEEVCELYISKTGFIIMSLDQYYNDGGTVNASITGNWNEYKENNHYHFYMKMKLPDQHSGSGQIRLPITNIYFTVSADNTTKRETNVVALGTAKINKSAGLILLSNATDQDYRNIATDYAETLYRYLDWYFK